MIIYPLACDEGHCFEGWFASAEACEKQAAAGLIQCPTCASAQVRKLPPAPHVRTAVARESQGQPDARRAAIVALRQMILASTENVGRQFPEIARRIHYREEKARGIRGQATHEEAEALRDEGVPAISVPREILPGEEVH